MAQTNVQAFSGDVEVTSNLAVDTNTFFVDSVANRVGIGVTNPQDKLSVTGDIRLTGAIKKNDGVTILTNTGKALTAGNADTVTTAAENDNGTSRFITFVDSGSGSQSLKTDTGLKYVSSTNALTASIFSGTHVGTHFGTISGSNTGAFSTITASLAVNSVQIPLIVQNTNTGTSAGAGIDLKTNNIAGATARIHALRRNTNGRGDLIFSTKSATGAGDLPTERMRIMSAGNVGISNTNPQDKLHVTGDIRLTGAIKKNDGVTILTNTGKALTAGNADTVTIAKEDTGTTSRFIAFVDEQTGSRAIKTDTGLKYVPSTNELTAGRFSGTHVGTHFGTISGSNTGAFTTITGTHNGTHVGTHFGTISGSNTGAFTTITGTHNGTHVGTHFGVISGSNTGAFSTLSAAALSVTNSTASTSTTTGALVVTGGVGVGGTITGNGSGLTTLNLGLASHTGTIAAARIPNLNTSKLTLGTLPVARGGTGVTSSTGTGNNVLSAGPTFSGTIGAAALSMSAQLSLGAGASASLRQTSTNTWTGDPGSGVGKIEYHSHRWYIVAGSNSTELLRVRRNNADRFVIGNDGTITVGSVPSDRITSGTLAAARIPNLNTSKLTAGTLAVARGGTGVTSSTGTGSTVRSANPTFSGVIRGGSFSGSHYGQLLGSNTATVTHITANSSFNRHGTYKYFNQNQNLNIANFTAALGVYALFDCFVRTIMVPSDSRIKRDIKDINDTEALEILRTLEPKKYKYKDPSRGDSTVYGFIAQEVANVFPVATSITTGYVPNVLKEGMILRDIFTFEDYDTSQLLTSNVTDNVKMIIDLTDTTELGEIEVIAKMTEIIDSKKVKLEIDYANTPGLVQSYLENPVSSVMYGQEITDFTALKKDHIWTITTSALQEVDRSLNTEKLKLINLQNEVKDLMTRVSILESSN